MNGAEDFFTFFTNGVLAHTYPGKEMYCKLNRHSTLCALTYAFRIECGVSVCDIETI
jgi:hypothetical protein